MVSWIAAITTGCSGNLSVSPDAFSILTLLYPNLIYRRWIGFVASQFINVTTYFSAWFEHILPKLSRALLLLNAISIGVMAITLFAMLSTRTSAEDFIKVVDTSGCSYPYAKEIHEIVEIFRDKSNNTAESMLYRSWTIVF